MWNKISEKLPEENVEVLCQWDWGNKRGNGKGMNVCCLIDGFWEGAEDYAGTVTHWMPLPTPPNSDAVENSNSAALRKTIRKWWEDVPTLKLSDDDIDELICALPSTGNQQPHVNITEET